jgi:hypothetical protein
MKIAQPVPLQKLDTTLNAEARAQLHNLGTAVTTGVHKLGTAESQLEYYTEALAWFNQNITSRQGQRAGSPSELVPMSKMDSTIHGDARMQLTELATAVTAACQKLSTVEAHMEYFNEGRDWFISNIANIEGTRTEGARPEGTRTTAGGGGSAA